VKGLKADGSRTAKAFILSLAHSLRYELRDSGVAVTALQPGPTNTDFFHRAGMNNTEVGSKGKSESQPDDVGRQGRPKLSPGCNPGLPFTHFEEVPQGRLNSSAGSGINVYRRAHGCA
jgi:NAD(P)-dependent dehydrogenase (short-subunit alcohol dehydrogenase family)